MANLCIKTPSSAIQVLIFQLLVLRPCPNGGDDIDDYEEDDSHHDCRRLDGMNWPVARVRSAYD